MSDYHHYLYRINKAGENNSFLHCDRITDRVSVHSGPSTTKLCMQSAINPDSCAIYSRVQWNTATHKIKIHCKPLRGPWCVPGRSAKFSSQHWKLSCARSTGEGNCVVQCHIITESPVTDTAAPGLVFFLVWARLYS